MNEELLRALLEEFIQGYQKEWMAAGHESGKEAIIWWWCYTEEVPVWSDMSTKDLARAIKAGSKPVTYQYVLDSLLDAIDGEDIKDYIENLEGFYLNR